jgi:N-acyl-D-amino-acid deacylase
MLDTVIRGATVVDGSGNAPFTGDVGIQGGRIAAVGGKLGAARREIDARGAIVTPGWVDVHTHYDGQVTWDPYLSPSTQHGVTTAVMGNCGVGFAPVKPERREWLISVMEGVEDIPGTVLSEGIEWAWESFPEYLDALAAKPRALDVGAQVPHSAVRTYVMGERGVTHDEATADDIRAMCAIVGEGLQAGALGFSTSRTLIHKYQQHKYPPGTFSSPEEILGIAKAMKAAGHGVFQMTANHVGMEGELWWLTQIARDNHLPVAFALVQTDQTPDTWRRLLAHLDGTHAQGVPLYGSISGRATSMVMGFEGSLHPFVLNPLWQQIAPLPWDAEAGEAARAAGARHADQHEGGGDGGAGQPGGCLLPARAWRGCLCCAPTPMAAWTTSRCWATAWWRRHRRPAPTRWKLPTTRCWPTTAPAARGTTARACCTSRCSTTATATCRRSTPSCSTRAP